MLSPKSSNQPSYLNADILDVYEIPCCCANQSFNFFFS